MLQRRTNCLSSFLGDFHFRNSPVPVHRLPLMPPTNRRCQRRSNVFHCSSMSRDELFLIEMSKGRKSRNLYTVLLFSSVSATTTSSLVLARTCESASVGSVFLSVSAVTAADAASSSALFASMKAFNSA